MNAPGSVAAHPTIPAESHSPSAAGPEGGRIRADPRLPAYLVAGFGALVAGIVTGQHEVVALGAPLLVLAALGLLHRPPSNITGEVKLYADRVIEGDVVAGEACVSWSGEARVDVLLTGWHGVSPVEPGPVVGLSLPAGSGPLTLPFTIRAQNWGIHDVGTLWVRAGRPGGLTFLEQKLPGATLRVLPTALRLDRMLKPAEPRAVSGMHLSRLRGQGTDFAELRPYRPGDRLRNLSWATSARHHEPWVAVHHVERTGTVLLLLDSFGRDRAGAEALARAARAAWAVASVHLNAQDRVGLLAYGRAAAWLAPRGGRRARWQLLEELLAVGGAAEDQRRARRAGGRAAVPADALVVGVTELGWRPFIGDLLHYRRAGHTTVALVIDTTDLMPESSNRVDEAARRIRIAQRESERLTLDRGGVPTAMVTAADGVAPAISALRRRVSAMQASRKAVAR